MPYNFAADSFHTKKLCSRLSLSEVHFLMKISRFAFLRPPLGDLQATYDDHLRLIGKRVVDFLLALIELFRQVLRLRRYERLLVENRRYVLSYGIKIWTDLSTVLSQYTRVTDGQTEFSSQYRVCITCRAVKNDSCIFHQTFLLLICCTSAVVLPNVIEIGTQLIM